MTIAKSQVCCGARLETRSHSFTALKQECVSSWVYGRGRNRLRHRLYRIASPLRRRARLPRETNAVRFFWFRQSTGRPRTSNTLSSGGESPPLLAGGHSMLLAQAHGELCPNCESRNLVPPSRSVFHASTRRRPAGIFAVPCSDSNPQALAVLRAVLRAVDRASGAHQRRLLVSGSLSHLEANCD